MHQFSFAFLQIDKGLMQRANMVERVRCEVEIHSRLKHPSILEVYAFFEDVNYVYLVLELCARGELHRFLKALERPLNEDEGSFKSLFLYFAYRNRLFLLLACYFFLRKM